MPFNWRDYLTVAAHLESQASEAAKRSAVSRSYYAAYQVADQRRKADGLALSTVGGPHQKMWNAYKFDPDSRRKKIALEGGRLHKRRKAADYKDTFPNLNLEAKLVVAAATKLIADIDAL